MDAGLALPCNVVVYEDREGAEVVIADPEVIVRTVGRAGLVGMARDAREKLRRVAAALGA